MASDLNCFRRRFFTAPTSIALRVQAQSVRLSHASALTAGPSNRAAKVGRKPLMECAIWVLSLLPARDIGGVDRGPTSSSSNRFAIDSPLEEDGFEPSVPPEKEPTSSRCSTFPALPFREGPRVRIRLGPPLSPSHHIASPRETVARMRLLLSQLGATACSKAGSPDSSFLKGPIRVSFAFAWRSTARSQRNEDISEHENSFDNLLYRSARVERVVAVHCGEPFPSVFFGGFFGGRPVSDRGDNRHPRRGARAQAPQSRGSQAHAGPGRQQSG